MQPGELKCEPEIDPETTETSVIAGQLLTLDDQHKIAIHSRAGELWVAEFHGDQAELVRAAAWFRLHYGICHVSFSLRRALRSAVPLSNEMEVAIEKLHQRTLERAPRSSSFRPISAARIAGHPASVIFAGLAQCCRSIRDWLVASKKPVESRNPMNAWDAVGFLASGLVITAFCMKDILHLRIVAVASNVAFMAYGVALGLMPVWLLHLVLLPVNLGRLWHMSSRIAIHATRDHAKARLVVPRAPGRRRIRNQSSRAIEARYRQS
jgi:hypothetical protein